MRAGFLLAAALLPCAAAEVMSRTSFDEMFVCLNDAAPRCGADFSKEDWGCNGPVIAPRCVQMLGCLAKRSAECVPKGADFERAAAEVAAPVKPVICAAKAVRKCTDPVCMVNEVAACAGAAAPLSWRLVPAGLRADLEQAGAAVEKAASSVCREAVEALEGCRLTRESCADAGAAAHAALAECLDVKVEDLKRLVRDKEAALRAELRRCEAEEGHLDGKLHYLECAAAAAEAVVGGSLTEAVKARLAGLRATAAAEWEAAKARVDCLRDASADLSSCADDAASAACREAAAAAARSAAGCLDLPWEAAAAALNPSDLAPEALRAAVREALETCHAAHAPLCRDADDETCLHAARCALEKTAGLLGLRLPASFRAAVEKVQSVLHEGQRLHEKAAAELAKARGFARCVDGAARAFGGCSAAAVEGRSAQCVAEVNTLAAAVAGCAAEHGVAQVEAPVLDAADVDRIVRRLREEGDVCGRVCADGRGVNGCLADLRCVAEHANAAAGREVFPEKAIPQDSAALEEKKADARELRSCLRDATAAVDWAACDAEVTDRCIERVNELLRLADGCAVSAGFADAPLGLAMLPALHLPEHKEALEAKLRAARDEAEARLAAARARFDEAKAALVRRAAEVRAGLEKLADGARGDAEAKLVAVETELRDLLADFHDELAALRRHRDAAAEKIRAAAAKLPVVKFLNHCRVAEEGLCAEGAAECFEQLRCAARRLHVPLLDRVAGFLAAADRRVESLRTVYEASASAFERRRQIAGCVAATPTGELRRGCAARGAGSGAAACEFAVRRFTKAVEACSPLLGKLSAPLTDAVSAGFELQRAVADGAQRLQDEARGCAPGRRLCSGSTEDCVEDVKCVAKAFHKAGLGPKLPLDVLPTAATAAKVDCFAPVGRTCGTDASASARGANGLLVACGLRVFVQCTASQKTSDRIDVAARDTGSCLRRSADRCGFVEEARRWPCAAGAEHADACYDMLDCAGTSTSSCYTQYGAALLQAVGITAEAPAEVKSPSAEAPKGADSNLMYAAYAGIGAVGVVALGAFVWLVRGKDAHGFEELAGSPLSPNSYCRSDDSTPRAAATAFAIDPADVATPVNGEFIIAE